MATYTRLLPYFAGSLVALGMSAAIVKPWEGKSNAAYVDATGTPTICYGYTSGVRLGDYRPDDDCEMLLAKELKIAFAAIDRHVKTQISVQEAAAYASLIYNIGQGNFARSTLLRKLNAGDRRGACNQLLLWVFSKGKKLRGLVRRREAERELCLSGISLEASASLPWASQSAQR